MLTGDMLKTHLKIIQTQKYKPDAWPGGGNMNHRGGAVIFHGTKGTLFCGCYGADPWLSQAEYLRCQKSNEKCKPTTIWYENVKKPPKTG